MRCLGRGAVRVDLSLLPLSLGATFVDLHSGE